MNKERMGLKPRESDRFFTDDRGSMLLHMIIVLIVMGLIGSAMMSLMSTSVVQQVFSDVAVQADLHSESGYRYLTTRYKAATTEIDKNDILNNLHGKTFALNGHDGQFSLSVAPYYYVARTDHTAGSTRLSAEFPGIKPDSVSLPGSGILGILSGNRYTLYSYTSRTGTDQAFEFQNIMDTADSSPGLNMALLRGQSVNPVLTCETRVLSNGSGNLLNVIDSGRVMPSEQGVFDIITRTGEFKDGNGNRTTIYSYKTRVNDTLHDISVYNDPNAVFSLSLTSNSRIVAHRSALIESTGTVNAGNALETNRSFSQMAVLGDTLANVSATDLILDNPDNVLVDLIDTASSLGDSDTVPSGKIGDAMAFDGDLDYVRLADNALLDLSHAGSIGAWLKVTSFDNDSAGIIRKGGRADDSDLAYSLEFTPDKYIRLRIHSTSASLSIDSKEQLHSGIWYHVAGTFGPAGMFLYINGQQDNFNADTLVVRNTDGTVQIGAQLDEWVDASKKNYGFHGVIDEVFVYTSQEDLCGIRDIFSNPCNTGCDALAYYPFNETYDDQSGELKNGNDAINGTGFGTSFSDDPFGCASQSVNFRFWSHVEMSSESSFDFNGPFTVAAWVRMDEWLFTFGNDPFVAKGNNSFRLQRFNNSNNASLGTTGLSSVDTVGTKDLHDGKWHHLVGVYSGSSKELYVDGVSDAFDNVSGSLHLNNSRVRIGSTNLGSVFSGRIDDVGFWNRALDQTEVTNIYKGLRTDPSLP